MAMMAAPATGPAGSNVAPVPLWRLLQAVAACLMAVRGGQSGTAALDNVQAPLRPAVQALMYQVWRSLARAENLRRQLATRAPPPLADALLCSVLALGWRAEGAPYEAFTLVNQAVEAAKRQAATQAQAGFVNGCLRRFLRERDALVARSEQDPVAVWNHPQWWIERLRKDHPSHWQDILRADLQHAPMTLRVNTRKLSRADYLAQLASLGIAATPIGESGVCLQQALPVQRLPGFDAGWVSVQDAAGQMAAPLLLGDAHAQSPSLRVLDACAAPGGKTAHLLERANCQVTALDVDPVRCQRISQTLQRLGLQADVRAADAAQVDAWWDGRPFDAILLDAPCTASGIVRRHPDVPWLRRPSDVAQLVEVQARLLRSLWPLLRPGGRMVYCTCSVFRAEGDIQIQTFVEHNTDAALLPSPGHLRPGLAANGMAVPDNQGSDHDGFFYALLEKRAT
jgi:16S rRNA (cytosine967-C5)-methyltransferase